MTHVEICPICNGTGKYREVGNYTPLVYTERQCHGCNGKGWVVCLEEYDFLQPENITFNPDINTHIPTLS